MTQARRNVLNEKEIRKTVSLMENYQKIKDSTNEKNKLLVQIEKILNSPLSIAESPLMAEDSKLRQEALICADAFEAVSNGMHNPQALKLLDTVSEKGVFRSWKFFIQALAAFYADNKTECLSSLDKISSYSCLQSAAEVLRAFYNKKYNLNASKEKFLSRIKGDNSRLESQLELLIDALEADMDDLFLEYARPLFDELLNLSAQAAEELVYNLFRELLERDKNPNLLVKMLKGKIKESKTMRLLALALAEYDQELALLFWLRCFNSSLAEKQISKEEIAAYLSIISEYLELIEAPSADINASLDSLFKEAKKRLLLIYPQAGKQISQAVFSQSGLKVLKSWFIYGEKVILDKTIKPLIQHKREESRYKTISRKNEPVQLDLFAS